MISRKLGHRWASATIRSRKRTWGTMVMNGYGVLRRLTSLNGSVSEGVWIGKPGMRASATASRRSAKPICAIRVEHRRLQRIASKVAVEIIVSLEQGDGDALPVQPQGQHRPR